MGTGFDKADLCHLVVGGMAALLAGAALVLGWPFCVPALVVVGVNVYLAVVLVEFARRSGEGRKCIELPHRTWSLLQMVLIGAALVSAFAAMYIKTEGVVHVAGTVASETDKGAEGAPSQEVLVDRVDACYFSLVTFTTLGYGDYLPATRSARVVVMWELVSGILLLLVTLPVVVSRVSTFE